MSVTYQTIELSSVVDRVARITLNQPEKRNPMGPLVAGELVDALRILGANDDCGCVVLTGAGRVFSAGGDLSQMSGGPGRQGGVAPASLQALFGAMHKLGKPIIAMVNGHALAGGLGLMVACDLAIASDAATFGTTEIRLGLWPMMITAEITRNVGRKKALELMLTGKRIDGVEAERIGLINRVVAAAQLQQETLSIAREIASKSRATMALGLRAFYDSQDMEHGQALTHLEGELARVLSLEDAREGITAFFEKREPVWKGR